MLLSYDADTKDESLNNTAIELRRRIAARKLEKDIKNNLIDADTLSAMKDSNRSQREEHGSEQFTVSMAKVSQGVAMTRLNQHMGIHKNLAELDRDLGRITSLNKTRYDALGDLSKRIQSMRTQLQHHSVVTVENELNETLNSSTRGLVDVQFVQCSQCQRKILKGLYDAHVKACSLKNGLQGHDAKPPVFDVNINQTVALATFCPQPPRNLFIKSRGATYVELGWEPAVIDGGLPVTDYEVSYIVNVMEMNKATGKYDRFTENPDPILTSHWGMVDPICHYGYKLTDLRSGAEYTGFKVRCRNLRGWSDYCVINPVLNNTIKKKAPKVEKKRDMLSSVSTTGVDAPKSPDAVESNVIIADTQTAIKTSEPEPPSQPLFFRHHLVTSSCIHVSWMPPLYDGGQAITNYQIHYTIIERHINATSRNILIDKVCCYTVGNQLSAVIRNIGANFDVKDIYIKAVNRADLVGEAGYLNNTKGIPVSPPVVLHTNEASMYSQIKRQLHEASKLNTEYIESDFLAGIQQKSLRIEFMRELNVRLKREEPDPVELEEAAAWAAIQKQLADEKRRAELETQVLDKMGTEDMSKLLGALGGDADDDEEEVYENGEKKPVFVFPWRQRKAHFIRRIKVLEDRIKDCTDERYEIDKSRTRSTAVMKKLQTRVMNLKLELDSLKHFKGDSISSSILHGTSMKYQAKDFIKMVDVELNKCVAEIADYKLKVIRGEERKRELKNILQKTEERLKNRRAEFWAFNKTEQFMQNQMFKLGNHADNSHAILKKYFNFLRINRDDRNYCKELLRRKFERLITRKLRSCLCKWATGSFEDIGDMEAGLLTGGRRKPIVTGVGTKLLASAKEKRLEMQDQLRRAIAETADLKEKWKLVSLAPDSRKRLVNSTAFHSMEEGLNHVALQVDSLTFLYEGDGMVLLNNFKAARQLYEAQIIKLRSDKENIKIKLLSVCHGRMGRMFIKQAFFDRAIVEFDRQLSLAKEVDDKYEAAEAYYGMGIGYFNRAQYDYCVRYLNMAQVQFQALGNYSRCSDAMVGLRNCYAKLHKDELVAMFDEQIARIGDEMHTKLRKIDTTLSGLKARLVSSTASIELEVKLERTTHKVMVLRRYIDEQEEKLKAEEERLAEQEKETASLTHILERIHEETEVAYETDEVELWSDLVHDQPQMVDVEELKTRLHARKLLELAKLEEASKIEAGMHTVIRNCEDEIDNAIKIIDLEGGALATKARKDKPFRAMSFNPGNAAGNEVTGTATGGVENFVAAEGKNIHLFNNHSGELEYIFVGDDKHRVGEKAGHTAVVTCVALDQYHIFSGGVDEVIIAWNTKTYKKELEMHGHEGSITVLAVGGPILASGSADCTIRYWDKVTGTQLRVLHGHSLSVLCIDIGLTWMVSGSADEEVRVWNIKQRSAHTITSDTLHQLVGHEAAVTCVQYGKLEIMSGDCLGRIFIWWVETGAILRKCEVHKGPVRCMQFDAIHIVSGGVDACVCITDIATGEVLQSLRGHTRHVLQVSFDSTRILSAGADNLLLYWQWGKQTGAKDKFHIINKQETLVMISKTHDVTVEELMKWNGIYDMRSCFPGMKIIVRKGDPTALTQAEKAALEVERRRQVGVAYSTKKLSSATGGNKNKLLCYNRIEKLATDMDPHSLSNRLFGKDKHSHDILPDMQDLNSNAISLSNRLLRDEDTLVATTTDLAKHIKEKGMHNLRARYIFRAENMEDEWGAVSDGIGLAMIDLFVEYFAYDLVLHAKNSLRDKKSTIGRIYAYTQSVQDAKEAEERKAELLLKEKEEEEQALLRLEEEKEDQMLMAYELKKSERAQRRQLRIEEGQEDYISSSSDEGKEDEDAGSDMANISIPMVTPVMISDEELHKVRDEKHTQDGMKKEKRDRKGKSVTFSEDEHAAGNAKEPLAEDRSASSFDTEKEQKSSSKDETSAVIRLPSIKSQSEKAKAVAKSRKVHHRNAAEK